MENRAPTGSPVDVGILHPPQQDLLASTQGRVATNLVQVFMSLGGGWEIRDNRDPVHLLPTDMKDEIRERTKAWQGVLE